MFKNHQIDNHQYWNVGQIWKKSVELKFLDTWLAKFPEGANIIEQLWEINDYGQVLIISPECQKDKRACQRSKAILWSRLSWSRMGFLCPCRCRCSEPELMDLLQHNFQEILRKNIAKGTTNPRVEFCLLKLSNHKLLHKFHLQNLDQASTSKSQPNISISTKFKLYNLDQT